MAADAGVGPGRPGEWDWAAVRDRCLREAGRMLDREEAEDAVQEALARAWEHRASCRSQDRPLGWLLRITRNESVRLLELRARTRAREVAPTPIFEPGDEDGLLLGAPLRLTVERALCLLPRPDRELLELHYTRELSHAEIAERFRIPHGTVKVRLHRARRRLAALLGEANEAPHRDN